MTMKIARNDGRGAWNGGGVCAFEALDSCFRRNDGGRLLWCVWDGVILEAVDSCPCFRRGDVLSQE